LIILKESNDNNMLNKSKEDRLRISRCWREASLLPGALASAKGGGKF
jgi:hypothetical protein